MTPVEQLQAQMDAFQKILTDLETRYNAREDAKDAEYQERTSAKTAQNRRIIVAASILGQLGHLQSFTEEEAVGKSLRLADMLIYRVLGVDK